jgi:hypothetical protein
VVELLRSTLSIDEGLEKEIDFQGVFHVFYREQERRDGPPACFCSVLLFPEARIHVKIAGLSWLIRPFCLSQENYVSSHRVLTGNVASMFHS